MQGRIIGRASPDEYVEFVPAGEHAKGEFRCSDCGYGVTVHRDLPVCPTCGGGTWEQAEWSPFMRHRNPLSTNS